MERRKGTFDDHSEEKVKKLGADQERRKGR